MSKIETATFGGGCFWCLEAVFRHIEGVKDVVSGYAGGNCPGIPTYREVCSGKTGHAEVIQVRFDTTRITFSDVLKLFMSNHNPTLDTYMKGDYGSQYRSIVLYHSKEQEEVSLNILQEMRMEHAKNIRTELAEFRGFFKAEDYHQDYFTKNKEAAYCRGIIAPKIEKLKQEFIQNIEH
ncbi:Peptide methionine sulfoxide reductase msrA [Cellulophaga algicola DSM 14237]|uniref:Peptide methionine sulfoxide reductase MsrA n=1 Tax=Cellulophaga algicola (strain DSM 14237 / IC166 / ACAM 630) TaxID=688270 RepID=E6X8C1_CELAD|nr:peptide-methionine (S)-S-oxide reductase MsrA [Cellulophaga algicola]ADV50777.1 Peptide methionine sulfoxide reductase msrA [Cellulophaga algicola DSM 14237]